MAAGPFTSLLIAVVATASSVGGPSSSQQQLLVATPAAPCCALSLVPDSAPVLVAQASTLLYYPMLQHVFHNNTASAILLRAQTSPDVDIPCADATFVSYTGGETWQPSAPEVGTSKYGPHVQKRVCYPYPPSNLDGDSALCLPYARDAAADSAGAALSIDFAGTIWRRNATTGTLAPVAGTVDAVTAKFTGDPHLVLGSRRYTDGNVLPTVDNSGFLITLYSTPGVHKQEMPLSIHVYNSSDLLTWQFRARLGKEYLASENWMVRLKDGRIMMVFRSELPQRKLFQTFSSDEGRSWLPPATLSGAGPGGDPHAVEPKLVRIGKVGALALSSGRAGQFIWFADEEAHAPGGSLVPIEAALWQSFDIQAHHDATLKAAHPDWCFHGATGAATGGYTGYSSLSLLPDDRLVVAYDRMPAGQPHGSPPTPAQGKDRIFALRFTVKRGTPPIPLPPPPPGPSPWSPNATCQAQADRWCTQHCFDKIAPHTPSCGHGPMVARCSGASDSPPGSPARWRCYSASTLDPGRIFYVNGSCYCSMNAGIRSVLAQCGEPAPSGLCKVAQPRQWTLPFVGGTEGYRCFRIPSLLALRNGRRLLFAEGRKNCLDGPYGDHIDVVMKISTDLGRSWGPLRKVYGESEPTGAKPVWITNPAPILLDDALHHGHVILICSRNNQNVLALRSSDSGETFGSLPVDISAQVVLDSWKYVATGPAAGIQLRDTGRLIVW